MNVVGTGRLRFPAHSSRARRYAERNLLSLHGRGERLRAIVTGARLRTGPAEDPREALPAPLRSRFHGIDDWLMLRDYAEGERARSLAFLFTRGDEQPSLVVKMRDETSAGPSLQDEADALRAIAPQLPPELRGALPEVREIGRDGGFEILVLSSVPGTPLSILMQRALRPRRRNARHLVAAGAWLGAFHAATRRGECTAVHGDFWPRNLLFGGGNEPSGVVDWEHASLEGQPWRDLFMLPVLFVSDAPAWRPRDEREQLIDAFGRRGRLNGMIREYFGAYSRSSGVSLPTIQAEFARYAAAEQESLGVLRGNWPAAFAGEAP